MYLKKAASVFDRLRCTTGYAGGGLLSYVAGAYLPTSTFGIAMVAGFVIAWAAEVALGFATILIYCTAKGPWYAAVDMVYFIM